MTKNQQISALILKAVEGGMELKNAFDMICGVGSYDRLVTELYHDLRARKGVA